jgi:hypothetical protein
VHKTVEMSLLGNRRKTVIDAGDDYRSPDDNIHCTLRGSTLSDQVGELNCERQKGGSYGFLTTSSRLEEVRKMLMSFFAPEEKTPHSLRVLGQLSLRILETGRRRLLPGKTLKRIARQGKLNLGS